MTTPEDLAIATELAKLAPRRWASVKDVLREAVLDTIREHYNDPEASLDGPVLSFRAEDKEWEMVVSFDVMENSESSFPDEDGAVVEE